LAKRSKLIQEEGTWTARVAVTSNTLDSDGWNLDSLLFTSCTLFLRFCV